MASDNDESIMRIANLIIRPTDPGNTHRPLADFVQMNTTAPMDRAKEAVKMLEHARVGAKNRIGETVFSNAHLISERPLLSDDLYRGETEKDMMDMEKYRYAPYSQKRNQHMPPTLIEDALGPLYTGADRDLDREGHPLSDTERIKEKKWLVHRFNKLSIKIDDDIARMAALMLCLTKVCKSSLLNWVKEDLPIPDCCFIIAQPWIRIRMSSGLWAEGGKSTAETGYNYEDVVLGFNSKNKTWHMHYTLWLGCFIYTPWKYIIMKDIKFEGYLSGMDDTINDDPTMFDAQNLDWTTVRSSFVFSCGATFSRDLALKTANPLCLYGKYNPKALPYNFANRKNVFDPNGPLFPSFLFYEFLWGFTSINANTDIDYSSYAAIRQSTYVPGMMLMANHFVYDDVTKDYTKFHQGNGHLDSFHPPMLNVLNGKVMFPNNKYKRVTSMT